MSVSWTDPVAQASPRVPNQAANHEDTCNYHMMTIQSRSDDIKAPKNVAANTIINRINKKQTKNPVAHNGTETEQHIVLPGHTNAKYNIYLFIKTKTRANQDNI